MEKRELRGAIGYADANRLLCELASVKVECEECGRASVLGFQELQSATFSGAYSYRMLCEKLRCSQCPPRPRRWRKLSIAPVWRGVVM